MNRWKDTLELLLCAVGGLIVGFVIFEILMEEIILWN
jgi:hypothetical protein